MCWAKVACLRCWVPSQKKKKGVGFTCISSCKCYFIFFPGKGDSEYLKVSRMKSESFLLTLAASYI